MADPKAPTRQDLAKFLPDVRAARAFERLFERVGVELPEAIDDALLSAANGEAMALAALDALERLEQALLLTPSDPKAQHALDALARLAQDMAINTAAADQKAQAALDTLSDKISKAAAVLQTLASGLLSHGAIASDSASAGMGYAAGAGGVVTQLTSKATGVTLDKVSGQITLFNDALAGGAKVAFVVTDSACAATDGVLAWVASGGTANAYRAAVTAVAAGSFTITVENLTGGSLSEAPVLGFAILKAVAA